MEKTKRRTKMTGYQIYAIAWVILELICIGIRLGMSKSKIEFVGTFLGIVISTGITLPLYIAGFLYIFK
jgi:hypothetical protein